MLQKLIERPGALASRAFPSLFISIYIVATSPKIPANYSLTKSKVLIRLACRSLPSHLPGWAPLIVKGFSVQTTSEAELVLSAVKVLHLVDVIQLF